MSRNYNPCMEGQTIQWLNDKRRKDKNDPQYTTQWTTHIPHSQNPSDELLILQLRFIIQEIKLDGTVMFSILYIFVNSSITDKTLSSLENK